MAGLGDQVDIVAKGAEIWDNSKVYSLNHWSDHASINKNGGGGGGRKRIKEVSDAKISPGQEL